MGTLGISVFPALRPTQSSPLIRPPVCTLALTLTVYDALAVQAVRHFAAISVIGNLSVFRSRYAMHTYVSYT